MVGRGAGSGQLVSRVLGTSQIKNLKTMLDLPGR